jgi:hypothetical protein
MVLNYRIMLECKLEFPDDWQAVLLFIGNMGASFKVFTADEQLPPLDELLPARMVMGSGYSWLFFHYHEMMNCLDTEPGNRALHIMAELISTYCKGPGLGKGLEDRQIELPF